ncbi:senescence-associated protein DIN1-like [Bidens hawaiensis]|uniref:senescence-associated protein DIN1-like n=1 Tax=Bidens hawaiensis TaxID=980011 RepID=UPI004049BB99
MATVAGNATPVTPTSVPVRVAHELHQAGHRYLDVRYAAFESSLYQTLILPYRICNIYYLIITYIIHIIIQGCQLGKRSLMAATDLLSSGFTGVTDIAGGYAAWNQNGLPIES